MSIGDRIRTKRKDSKLTQSELGQLVNVSSQVISNWERGYSDPNHDDVSRLSVALEVSTEYLHGRNDLSSKKPDADINKESGTISEINKILKEHGIEDSGFFDIDEWKSLSPEDMIEIKKHFEWVAQKAKERNREKD